MTLKHRLVLAFAALVTLQVHAACRYPIADGGEPHPSAPNVVGTVATIGASRITLRTDIGNVKIAIPRSGVFYTAFGGDDHIDKLKEGLVARAWYVGCKVPQGGVAPQVAYLEVYSSDPNDRPPPSYWKRY